MFTFPIGHFSTGDGRTINTLDTLVGSTVCDLDITVGDSYDGTSQTILNLIGSPNDGSGQTVNNFFLGSGSGSDSGDPAFVGIANDPAAYLESDGGDFLTSVDGVGSPNAVTLRDLAKNTSGNAWWIAIAFKTVTVSNAFYWGQAVSAGNIGIEWFASLSGTNLEIKQLDGTTSTSKALEATLISDTNQLVIFSSDMNATSNNIRAWRNTSTKTESSKTWLSNSSNTNGLFRVGASDNEGTPSGPGFANGIRIYAFSYGDAFIDNADVALIKAEYEARHERTYDT